MATSYGTNATKILNSSIPKLAEQGEGYGKMRVHYDEFDLSVAAAVVTSGDVIKMGAMLPANALVLHVECDTADLDAQSACAFTYGWAASADAVEAAQSAGFMSSMDAHTAAIGKGTDVLSSGTVVGKFKRFSAAVQPQIAITGTGDAVTGKIKCAIYFVVE